MSTDKRVRAKLNVQLSDKPDAFEAAEIVKKWKLGREAANHLIRAIRLYAALLKGDSSLLQEFFPQFGVFMSTPRPKTPIAPVPVVERNEEQELDNLLDMFGDGLEF